ncbi:MAG: phosphate acetyltransferase [Phycicoccus sp.]|nr:phosphate acetyltransferase [Phycicoccus sp.]
MTATLYISATDARSGKSAVALGLLHQLARRAGRVGIYRPIVHDATDDDLLELLLSQIDTSDRGGRAQDRHTAFGVTYATMHADPEAALTAIVDRFHAVAQGHDVVVVIGSDFSDVAAPTEFAVNARVAANLGAPMLLVLPGAGHDPHGLVTGARLAMAAAREQHAAVAGFVVNQVPDGAVADVETAFSGAGLGAPAVVIPDVPLLRAPTMADLVAAMGGTLVHGDPAMLERECLGLVVAAMTLPHVLDRLIEGGVVVVPGDREEIVLGALTAHRSKTFPSLTGIVLNGGFALSPQISRLIDGVDVSLPIVAVDRGTMATARILSGVPGRITAGSHRKIEAAVRVVEDRLDAAGVLDAHIAGGGTRVVTPLMFEHELVDGARRAQSHIVLPEGAEPRIIRAAGICLDRGIARLTLLGDPDRVRAVAAKNHVDLRDAVIVDPTTSPLRASFAQDYATMRAHKGMTVDAALDLVVDPSYFGTMMVHAGLADGMVSGSITTTAATVRPALEIVRTSPGVSVVSSVFFMCLADRVLVYGDCAINPDPNAEQLADIAISSARTAAQFGIEPRLAMLSYSTGSSGTGADVDKVRAATALVREREPDLLVEGPLQYDAAVDPHVAATKMSGSPVAGQATVLVFPDLNTGNNTYKAVQRSASAIAIGPILQGLGKPVNDLSRGALVRDIVNTISITAIQAGA